MIPGEGDTVIAVVDGEPQVWARYEVVVHLLQLRGREHRLRDWVRRGLVDPPRQIGPDWWYRLDQADDAEYATRTRTGGGRRRRP